MRGRITNWKELYERLRKNFYHLYKPLMEAQRTPGVLDEWRRAPRGSVGWRNLIFHAQALRVVLEVVLSDR